MAGQQRSMEGNEEQRQAKARKAREQGKSASEVGASLGASKQRKEVPRGAHHEDRLERSHEGKQQRGSSDKPRPGSRRSRREG